VIVAQTNLQLYRQLEAAGWSTADRQRARSAYMLTAELHSGQYRASGKTFVAHLCGTASIVDAAGGTVDETLAALLHAAYEQGDFGDGRSVRTPQKSDEVRAAIGADAETLVAQYFDWPWRERVAELLEGGPDGLADWERVITFLRLANEIEERIDGADEYAPTHASFVLPLADAMQCAHLLGRESLVAIAHDVTDVEATSVPATLQSEKMWSGLVAPRSTSTRLWIRTTDERSPLRRAVRQVPGARRVVYTWRRWRPTSRSE